MKSLAVLVLLLSLNSFALDSTIWLSAEASDFYLQNGQQGQKDNDILELNTHQFWQGRGAWAFDSQLDIRSDQAATDSQDRFLLEPEEFRLQYRHRDTKLSLGYHREIWEGTDLLNPMDIATMKNEMDPLQPRDRASAGIYLSYDPGAHFDLFYVPYQTLPLLPAQQSYWWPRNYDLPLQSDQATLLFPNVIDYRIDPTQTFNHALDNNFGARVSGTLEPLDLSAAYFEGANSIPTLSPVLNANLISLQPEILQLTSPVEIRPEVYRVRRLAASATWTNTWFIAKLASQWNQPKGNLATQVGSSRLAVLEFEKGLSFRGQDLNLIAEWVEAQQADNADLAVLTALLKRGWSLGWRWAFTENLTWYTAYYREITLQSYFWTNHVDWKWNDQWSSEVSSTIFGGSDNSPLGVYRKNAQATLSVKYFLP